MALETPKSTFAEWSDELKRIAQEYDFPLADVECYLYYFNEGYSARDTFFEEASYADD